MAATADRASEVAQCDIKVSHGFSGVVQTFTLRVGGVLRIGRGMANDIVLNFNGVSVYHCELFLAPSSSSKQGILYIKDNAKNGTGIRPGPKSTDVSDGDANSWEALKIGVPVELKHGWQLIVPMRSRMGEMQVPEVMRLLTVYVGPSTVLAADTELDGEVWEPEATQLITAPKLPALVPPPPPDIDDGTFEEAPPPPPMPSADKVGAEPDAEAVSNDKKAQAAKARKHRQAGDLAEEGETVLLTEKERKRREAKLERRAGKDKEQRKRQEEERRARDAGDKKRSKKEKKLKKDKKRAKDIEERDAQERRERRREEREKKRAKKRRRGEDEEQNEVCERDGYEQEREHRRDRKRRGEPARQEKENSDEERGEKEHLERKKKELDERERLEQELEDEIAAELQRKARSKKSKADQNDADESAAPKAAAVAQETEAPAAPEQEAEENRTASVKAVAPSDGGTATDSSAPQAAAVIEISGSSGLATGIFLRCGLHCGRSMYRLLRDGPQPCFLSFSDGGGDETKAGWRVSSDPSKALGDCEESWTTSAELPLAEKGSNGGSMREQALNDETMAIFKTLPLAMQVDMHRAFQGVAPTETPGADAAEVTDAPPTGTPTALTPRGTPKQGTPAIGTPTAGTPPPGPGIAPRTPTAVTLETAAPKSAGQSGLPQTPAQDLASQLELPSSTRAEAGDGERSELSAAVVLPEGSAEVSESDAPPHDGGVAETLADTLVVPETQQEPSAPDSAAPVSKLAASGEAQESEILVTPEHKKQALDVPSSAVVGTELAPPDTDAVPSDAKAKAAEAKEVEKAKDNDLADLRGGMPKKNPELTAAAIAAATGDAPRNDDDDLDPELKSVSAISTPGVAVVQRRRGKRRVSASPGQRGRQRGGDRKRGVSPSHWRAASPSFMKSVTPSRLIMPPSPTRYRPTKSGRVGHFRPSPSHFYKGRARSPTVPGTAAASEVDTDMPAPAARLVKRRRLSSPSRWKPSLTRPRPVPKRDFSPISGSELPQRKKNKGRATALPVDGSPPRIILKERQQQKMTAEEKVARRAEKEEKKRLKEERRAEREPRRVRKDPE